MTSHQGNAIVFRSSQQLPPLGLRPLEGCWSRNSALQGPSFNNALNIDFETTDIHNTIRCGILCLEVQRHLQENDRPKPR